MRRIWPIMVNVLCVVEENVDSVLLSSQNVN